MLPLPPPEPVVAVHAQQAPEARIRVKVGGRILRARLTRNPTTNDLLQRLPLTATFRDFQGQEKLTRLTPGLTTRGAPATSAAAVGDIGYYAPDRVLVFYYKAVPAYPGIIRLGRFTSKLAPITDQSKPFRVRITRAR